MLCSVGRCYRLVLIDLIRRVGRPVSSGSFLISFVEQVFASRQVKYESMSFFKQ